jgi:hypothetical protein
MEKTIQLTLNQDEANLMLRAVEELQNTLHDDTGSQNMLRDLSILWGKVFDTGIAGGFGPRE